MANVTRNQCIDVITAHFAHASTINVTATLVDRQKMTFNASTVYTDGQDTVTANVMSDSGVVKTYKDVDTIIREFAQGAPGVSTIVVSCNVDVLTPDRVSLDPAKQLAKEKAANAKWLTRQTAVVTKLDAMLSAISSYQSGNSAQVAAYNKLAAQRTVANELKTYVAALPQP
jgi:hypothetical protein